MNSSSDSHEETFIQSEKIPESLERQEEKPKMSEAFLEFSTKLNSFATPEEKIAFGLQFMRGAISQEGSPRFREFWESRRLVLAFFKDNLNPAIRSKLWGEYVELTVEARRLKEILEEQSVFAMEQIDLAISAIESDLTQFDTILSQAASIAFPEASRTIEQKVGTYNHIQKELNLLNTLASRLNGLRKEIVKTDMRIRFKTKFFKRLSELGDRIFPKRKELIEQVSAEFQKDIDSFIAKHFKDGEAFGAPYYGLREEIKALQGMAKVLTLSSSVFNRTRLALSECWDQVKVLEKEHKKVILEKKQASSEARQGLQTKIDELKAKSETLALRDLDKEIDLISQEMRTISLDRDDVRYLRDEFAKLRSPHIAAQELKAKEIEEAEKARIRLKKEKAEQLKERIASLAKEGSSMDLDGFQAQFSEVVQELAALDISKFDKQQMERLLRPLKDLLAEKKEQSLLSLSEDDRKALDNLRIVLQQKKERRQEIKEQVEQYRKTLGSSSLDFEKAMHFQELLSQEKELLEKANAGISEIEQKIADLES